MTYKICIRLCFQKASGQEEALGSYMFGASQKLYAGFQLHGVSAPPKPPVAQGSTLSIHLILTRAPGVKDLWTQDLTYREVRGPA